jgi:hypothetical protein
MNAIQKIDMNTKKHMLEMFGTDKDMAYWNAGEVNYLQSLTIRQTYALAKELYDNANAGKISTGWACVYIKKLAYSDPKGKYTNEQWHAKCDYCKKLARETDIKQFETGTLYS